MLTQERTNLSEAFCEKLDYFKKANRLLFDHIKSSCNCLVFFCFFFIKKGKLFVSRLTIISCRKQLFINALRTHEYYVFSVPTSLSGSGFSSFFFGTLSTSFVFFSSGCWTSCNFVFSFFLSFAGFLLHVSSGTDSVVEEYELFKSKSCGRHSNTGWSF